jgi:hypothetical protein
MSSPERSAARAVRTGLRAIVALGLAAPLTACFPGLALTPQEAVASKPSNVVVYFSADTNSGKAVTDLRPDGFSIFENGTRVTNAEGRQTLLRPVAAHYTLFLFDMSGHVLGTKEAGEVIKAATALSEAPDKGQNLTALYSFDGSPDLEAIVPFAATAPENDAAQTPTPRARSGPPLGIESAVVIGLRTLNLALAADPRPLKAGTLVLITDETNHGDRMRITDLRAALGTPDNRKIDILAVGVGNEVDEARLEDLGRNGTLLEPDPARVGQAFAAAEAKVVEASKRYYLLSYCTPARAGMQDVRIETHAPDGLMGEITYNFNADGFVPGCDPTAPPVLQAERVPEPPAVEKKAKEPPHHTNHRHATASAPPASPAARPAPAPSAPEAPASKPPPPRTAPAPHRTPPPASDPFAP